MISNRQSSRKDTSPTAQPSDARVPIKNLTALRSAEADCTRCPLYKFATQVVPGQGPARAKFMLVGEQPGDMEDRSGTPFVGPAGEVLDRALADAQIARSDVYVTNAVKHFKHEMRGKRRLHKRPDSYEIQRCNLWLEHEIELVKPSAIIALGATAARSLLGKIVTISSARRTSHEGAFGTRVFVTVHPSYLLRLREEADKKREFAAFVADLRRAVKQGSARESSNT